MTQFLHITEDVKIHHQYPVARPDELANNQSNFSWITWLGLGLGAISLIGFLCSKTQDKKPSKSQIDIDNIFNLILEVFRMAESDLKEGKDPIEIKKGLEPVIDSIIEIRNDFDNTRKAIIFNYVKRLDDMLGNN